MVILSLEYSAQVGILDAGKKKAPQAVLFWTEI